MTTRRVVKSEASVIASVDTRTSFFLTGKTRDKIKAHSKTDHTMSEGIFSSVIQRDADVWLVDHAFVNSSTSTTDI